MDFATNTQEVKRKVNVKRIPEINEDHLKRGEWFKPRLYTQLGFMGLVLWIGWEFVAFVRNIDAGNPVDISSRPPGVEGFLPISSLMELWLWVKSGITLTVHPAGVILIAFAIGTAFLMRRGFCSWLCPVGTISEFLTKLGIKAGVSIKPWKWLDIPLRGLKYLLLFFFLYVILGMSTRALAIFISGEYNVVSDIKMLDLFAPPDRMTWSVLGILALLTLAIKNFWCRYLCPYGALLGIFSVFSPMSIKRNAKTCIDCNLCDKECPSYLPVATKNAIRSAECLACQQCVAVCPVKDCLEFSAPKKSFKLKPMVYGLVFAGLFLIIVGIARLNGYWQTSADSGKMVELAKQRNALTHPRDINGY